MIKLTKQEWDRMKRPIFPDIQFVSAQDKLQIQTMLKLESLDSSFEEGYSYYKSFILYDTIKNINELLNFIMYFTEKANESSFEDKRYELDDNIYKIEEDGTN